MSTSTLEKPRTANMTVKLEDSERERLKSIAITKNRTPHFIMREALHKYLEEEEAEQRFIAAAKASLKEYKKTGLHITLDEFGAWAKAIKKNPKAPMPACHT
jgi:predicted transcriptional regulator